MGAMGEPWILLITTAIPSIIVAIIAHRAPYRQAEVQASTSASSLLDARMRDLLDRTNTDNVRLRAENAELAASMSHLMAIARYWYDTAADLRHGRNGDRAIAEAMLLPAGLGPPDWPPNPPLPGFEEID